MNLGKGIQILRSYKSASFLKKTYDPKRPTAFMHVPKTCGTALRLGLTEALAFRCPILIHDRVLFGSFDSFESFEIETRQSISADPVSLPAEADFVTGHISFSALAARYPRAQFFTVLREPVSRIVSHWLFWRGFSDEILNLYGSYARYILRSRASLADFLACRDVASQTDNVHLRMLLWPHRLIPEGDFVDERFDDLLLEQANARLQRFSFVDVVENPGFCAHLESWLERPFNYRLVNETPCLPSACKKPFLAELNSVSFELIEARSRLDLQLWLSVARKSVNGLDPSVLRARSLMLNAARHARMS